jgi:hypothetical protein
MQFTAGKFMIVSIEIGPAFVKVRLIVYIVFSIVVENIFSPEKAVQIVPCTHVGDINNQQSTWP